jgi:hypothetical protein
MRVALCNHLILNLSHAFSSLDLFPCSILCREKTCCSILYVQPQILQVVHILQVETSLSSNDKKILFYTFVDNSKKVVVDFRFRRLVLEPCRDIGPPFSQ